MSAVSAQVQTLFSFLLKWTVHYRVLRIYPPRGLHFCLLAFDCQLTIFSHLMMPCLTNWRNPTFLWRQLSYQTLQSITRIASITETHTFLHKHLFLLRSIFSFYQKQLFWVNVYPPPFAWHLQQCKEWLTMMESVQPRRRRLGNSVSKTLVKSAFILLSSVSINLSIISSFIFLRNFFMIDIHNSKSLHSSIIFISF